LITDDTKNQQRLNYSQAPKNGFATESLHAAAVTVKEEVGQTTRNHQPIVANNMRRHQQNQSYESVSYGTFPDPPVFESNTGVLVGFGKYHTDPNRTRNYLGTPRASMTDAVNNSRSSISSCTDDDDVTLAYSSCGYSSDDTFFKAFGSTGGKKQKSERKQSMFCTGEKPLSVDEKVRMMQQIPINHTETENHKQQSLINKSSLHPTAAYPDRNTGPNIQPRNTRNPPGFNSDILPTPATEPPRMGQLFRDHNVPSYIVNARAHLFSDSSTKKSHPRGNDQMSEPMKGRTWSESPASTSSPRGPMATYGADKTPAYVRRYSSTLKVNFSLRNCTKHAFCGFF